MCIRDRLLLGDVLCDDRAGLLLRRIDQAPLLNRDQPAVRDCPHHAGAAFNEQRPATILANLGFRVAQVVDAVVESEFDLSLALSLIHI